MNLKKNTCFETKVRNRVLTGQSREIICSVLEFMTNEKDAGKPIIDIMQVHRRVAAATGVSLSTVKRIKQEGRKIMDGNATTFVTPDAIRKKAKRTDSMEETTNNGSSTSQEDSFEIEIIKNELKTEM